MVTKRQVRKLREMWVRWTNKWDWKGKYEAGGNEVRDLGARHFPLNYQYTVHSNKGTHKTFLGNTAKHVPCVGTNCEGGRPVRLYGVIPHALLWQSWIWRRGSELWRKFETIEHNVHTLPWQAHRPRYLHRGPNNTSVQLYAATSSARPMLLRYGHLQLYSNFIDGKCDNDEVLERSALWAGWY